MNRTLSMESLTRLSRAMVHDGRATTLSMRRSQLSMPEAERFIKGLAVAVITGQSK